MITGHNHTSPDWTEDDQKASEPEMKPCPLCGGVARISEWECSNYPVMYAEVCCTKCGATGPVGAANNGLGQLNAERGEHIRDAIECWNERPSS